MRFISVLALSITLLLSACGGGGSGTSSGGDVFPGAPATVAATAGPDSFLLFPNPQKQLDGALQVDALEFANAYYAAIDPGNERDTLAKFKTKNGFGTSGPGITEETIIIGDQRDLGYGRKMTGRQNADGTIAFVVENYLVGAYGAYTPFNLVAAVNSEAKWHIGTNGIEFSPGPGGTVNFVKFYTFAPITGTRLLKANLDGRGDKAMPTICMSCHGGRGDALTPVDGASGKKLFAKVMNLASQARGDVAGQLHAFEPASFDFSPSLSGFTRASREAKIKTLNKMVLCGMPLPNGTTTPTPYPEDDCRRVANPNEYQGAAAEHLKNMYGGDGLPNASTNTTDTFVPSGWQSAGQSALYLSTVTQACRVCHALRGNGNQSDISFETFAQFDGYSDRIKAHVVDRGNMPLAKLVYDKYWSTSSIYGPMGNYLVAAGYADGALMPGRPIADPGPDRLIQSGTTTLSAAMSLFSSSYSWRVTSGAASLSNPTSAQPVFTATGGPGTYTVELVTSNGTAQSAAKTLTIVVNSLATDPATLRFSDIKDILQLSAANCVSCHVSTKNPATQSLVPPVYYDDYDRSGTGNATTNLNWFYNDVRSRINFTDIVASPLLRKPAGKHHGGGTLALSGFDTSLTVGSAGRADYDKIVGWILNGAPQ